MSSGPKKPKEDIMKQRVFIAKGVLISSIAAGPIFVAIFALLSLYGSLPNAVPVSSIRLDVETIAAFLGMGLLVLLFGFIFALLPNAVGGALLGKLGQQSDTARLPLIWAASGSAFVAIPIAIAGGLGGDDPTPTIALIITGGLCALIVRRHTKWVADRDEPATPAPAFVSPPAQSTLGHRNTGSRLLD
jgi:hypothetical protein